MFIVLTGHTRPTVAILVLTDQQPAPTQMLFGYRVTGFGGIIIAVFGFPATGKYGVKQPPVITVIAGSDINLAFGESNSPRVSFISMGLWWNW